MGKVRSDVLAQVRQSPGDPALREVLLDAWLEDDDPRAALALAERTGARIPEALAQCAARFPDGRLRLRRGLVVQLRAPIEAFVAGAADPLDEPLAVAAVAYHKVEELAPQLAGAARALGRFRGIRLDTTVDATLIDPFAALVAQARPDLLSFATSLPPEALRGRSWPGVTALELSGDAAAVLAVLEGTRSLRRLRVRGCTVGLWLPEALAQPDLVELDLVGVPLDDDDVAALTAWGGHVRHERFALHPGDPVDDPFGTAGLVWPPPPARTARGVLGADHATTTARGRTLQRHQNGDPLRQEPVAATITALGADGAALVVGSDDGDVRRDGELVVRVSGAVRAVSARDGALAVVHDGGWWLRSPDGAVSSGDDRPAALLVCERGVVHARGDTVVLADGRAVALGEPVLAAAVAGDEVIAVTPRAVWRLGADHPVHLWDRTDDAPPLVAAAGTTVVAATGARSVDILRGTTHSSCSWTDQYADSHGGALVVADLAAHEDGTVLAVLEAGGANLLLTAGALKADEFPGEPVRRWLFIYAGSILIAG